MLMILESLIEISKHALDVIVWKIAEELEKLRQVNSTNLIPDSWLTRIGRTSYRLNLIAKEALLIYSNLKYSSSRSWP